MCETCGCGGKGYTVGTPVPRSGEEEHIHDHEHADDHGHYHHSHGHSHDGDPAHTHSHSHEHGHVHDHDHEHDHVHDTHELSHEPAVHRIDLGIDILSSNNITAAMNRKFFEGRRVFCMNLVSSPGSGKTSLLEKTVAGNTLNARTYVIEGDQQTELDALRIGKAGATAIQVNTGSGCHLDARMIGSAVEKLNPDSGSVLFIENVGNLVCPALFDLGEHKRVLVISVTEGADKPLKYPDMFSSSDLCIINKSDLLPYVDFSLDEFRANASRIRPGLEFIVLSARTGEGMDLWYNWLESQYRLVSSF